MLSGKGKFGIFGDGKEVPQMAMARTFQKGDWRAGYVILDADKSDVKFEFVRVEYDLDAAVKAIRASELPDEFADYLAAGGKLAPASSDQDGETG